MLKLWLLRNHPRKAVLKIKTPLRSAESTSVHIARMIEADGPLPLAGVDDAFEPARLVI